MMRSLAAAAGLVALASHAHAQTRPDLSGQ
jgi:hypothetical protein